ESMQVDAKSESFFGPITHRVINGVGAHWTPLDRRPERSVRISTGDSLSEPFQIQIDVRSQFLRDRIVERPSCLGINGRDGECPMTSGFYEMFPDAQRYERAPPQGYER